MECNMDRALRYFTWAFCAIIVWGSVTTAIGARATEGHHADGTHAVMLGSIEAVAGALFAFRRVRLVAGTLLLVILGIATILTVLAREVPAHLVFYASTVAFILVTDQLKSKVGGA